MATPAFTPQTAILLPRATRLTRMRAAFAWLAAWLMLVLSRVAWAALPPVTPPTTAPATGDMLAVIKGWVKDGGIVLGLAIGVAAFLWLGWAALAKFHEARTGRAEWGEVGLTGVMAAAVAVFVVYMVNTASTII